MENTYFVFREAQSYHEIKSLMQLRYRVYRDSRLPFVKENEYGIDLDGHDLRSRHFGLFESGAAPIGYLRVVDGRLSPLHDKIIQVAAEFPRLADGVKCPTKHSFPLLTYFPDAPFIRRKLAEFKSRREFVVEVSRLSIDPDFRSAGLAKHIALSAMSFGFCCNGVDHALLTCSPLHKQIYERFGFEQLKGTSVHEVLGIPQWCCLIGSRQKVPSPIRDEIDRMGQAFRCTGQICYNPANPESFYAPVKRVRTSPQAALRVAA